MDLCSQILWQIEGKACCQRVYTSPRDRLQRNLFTSSKIWINLISTHTCSTPRLGNWGYGCQIGILTWSAWRKIYMEQLEGFVAKGEENKVCRLIHSIYGLKQAGWVWNRTFTHTIKKKLGFNTIHSDVGACILCHHHKSGDSNMDMILILYVDDPLLLGDELSKIEDIRACPATDCFRLSTDCWSDLILFGDLNYQKPKHSSYLNQSTGVHWKCTEEVQTSRCKWH